MKKIASVAISHCTREFDREYHYAIPEELENQVIQGMRAIVPFGKANKSVEAYVTELVPSTELDALKEIGKLIDAEPVLGKDQLALAKWMKSRYTCTFYEAVKCMLPPGIGVKLLRIVRLTGAPEGLKPKDKEILDFLAACGNECEYEELKAGTGCKDFAKRIGALGKKGFVSIYEDHKTRIRDKTVRVAYIARPREEIVEEIESNRIKRIQQIRVLEMLVDNEYISVQDISRFAGVSGSVLDTLKKYGYIDFKDIQVIRNPDKNRVFGRTEPLRLTRQQEEAVRVLRGQLDSGGFHETLLHGVTGSGKTEVYLQLIQYCMARAKQAIVLVPEISLTPQMVERFKGRFGDEVAVLHSRLSLGERHDQWKLIKDGRIKVVVGARSAVFAPVADLGMIIIDEEHENSYKSEITPKYHARDVARVRCTLCNAVLLQGSATPSVETYYRAISGGITLLKMTERPNNMTLPAVEIVDLRKELDEGNKSVFSRRLSEEIGENMKQGQQTILFLNRRGHASFILCRKCGYVMRCQNCNISLTYHSHDERLICHYCGYTVRNPETCPRCKSNYIRHFGTGTQKVEEEIKKQFPESSVIRMDMDTTVGKNSHEEILSAFRERNINIMVGTQMIAKGHDFPNVTLVGVLAADSLLNLDDYYAPERTFQLITQVAGRAGRGELPGRVIIQTYNTEDYSILSACKHDFPGFYEQEIRLREKLGYPPFTHIGVLMVSGLHDRQVFARAKEVKEVVKADFDENEALVLGPTRAPLSKIKNKYRWRIIIKCGDMGRLIEVLGKNSDLFYRKKGKSAVELGMDIDPNNML